MPLHADGKARHRSGGCGQDVHRLDRAVRGRALHPDAWRQLVDALVVQRVHRDLAGARQAMQPAAGSDPDRVRLADPHLARGDHRRGVVDPVRQVLQPLVQRAAQRHVQFLEAAADRQHRHAARHRRTDQRQGGAVARHVLPGAFGVRRAVIVAGMHVGAAAGEYDAVQPFEQGLDVGGRPVGRDQHRHGVHELVGRLDIGIGGGVVRHAENAELFGAAADADKRLDDPERPHWTRIIRDLCGKMKTLFCDGRHVRCRKDDRNQPAWGWKKRGSMNSNSLGSNCPPVSTL